MRYILAAIALGVIALLVYAVITVAPRTNTLQSQPGDGVYFGYIRAVEDGNTRTLVFDEARWLIGEEGKDAAIAAGLCTADAREECLPNDFFILNEATSTIPLSLSDNPIVAMQTLKMESEGVKETQISLSEFAKLINDTKLHWATLPYQILVEQGKITIIEEVYVP